MRSMWTKGLALALGVGLIGTSARAQAPGVSIGRPIVAIGTPVANSPAASISRPVAIASPATPVRQAAYSGGGLVPVVRGMMADPAPGNPASGLHGWQRANELPMPSGGGSGPVASTGPALPTTPGGAVIGQTPGADCGCGVAGGCGYGVPGGFGGGFGRGLGGAGRAYTGPMSGYMDGAMPIGRNYVTLDYLGWWVKGDHTPPLVAAQAAGASGANTGILPPVGGANILYGNSGLGTGYRSGLRLFAGHWFTNDRALGLEVGGFFLGELQDRFTAGSNGDPVIRRPIINQAPGTRLFGQNDGELVAGFGALAGSTSVLQRSSLWGYEMNLKRGLCGFCGESFVLDGLAGFRSLGLNESIAMGENLTVLTPGSPVSNFVINDKFSSTNRFYGGQVGLQGELWLFERLSLGMTGKVALGVTQSQTRIAGSTTFLNGNTNLGTGNGGLFALPSNIGTYNRQRFAVVPEVGLNLNYQVTNWMRISAGYTFLYWSSVQRPGEQIDPNVNFRQQPAYNAATGTVVPGNLGGGAAVPRFLDHSSDFWAQGFNIGLQFIF